MAAPYHEGSTLDLTAHSVTLSRGLEEYAARNEAHSSTHYGLHKPSNNFLVQVLNKAGLPAPAGAYALDLTITPPAAPAP